jgi:hypothetical protein
MKFGHLEQKFELSNQNMCKKFLKNNGHIYNKYPGFKPGTFGFHTGNATNWAIGSAKKSTISKARNTKTKRKVLLQNKYGILLEFAFSIAKQVWNFA